MENRRSQIVRIVYQEVCYVGIYFIIDRGLYVAAFINNILDAVSA